MAGLRQLQEHFGSYLLSGDARMEAEVISTPRVSARARLDIYADAYRLRLLECLAEDFPALQALLGEAGFDALGRRYIESHPSEHFSLRYFGRHLSRFLETTDPYRGEPWLGELAGFEWALGEAFDAADVPALTPEGLAGLPPSDWPTLRLCVHPSVRRLSLWWDVPAIWKAVDRQETPRVDTRADRPLGWLVWRRDLKVYFRSLGEDEAHALAGVAAGQSFGAICEGLCAWLTEAEVPARAAGLLRGWVVEGLLAAGPSQELETAVPPACRLPESAGGGSGDWS